MTKIRVIHVINSFEFGGAESMLCNLLLRANQERFESSAVSLIDDLTVADPIVRAGVPLQTMGFRPGVANPAAFWRLVRYLRRQGPHVIQTWMDHSNLIGGLAARCVPGAKVAWGVHHANHDLSKRSTLLAVKACARLSRCVPSRVIFCSEESRKLYTRHGFARERSIVIPNGFDTARFRPDPAARAAIRREAGIPEGDVVIGLAARYDAIKDHASFLSAAAMLGKSRPDVKFLLCGAKVDWQNHELGSRIRALGIEDRCRLLGPRRDMPAVYAAMDLLTSSSRAEAFPLAVGEAMACGVPCVATDVGDSALIVGEAGRVVPPADPNAICNAWQEILSLAPEARSALGTAARQRIYERFDLTAITRRYEAVYEQLIQRTVARAH